jgi:hypothetical protein
MDVGRCYQEGGNQAKGRSLPLEAARAISRHTRETFPAVGVHTRLVRAPCPTSVTGTCKGKGVVRDEALRDRVLDQRSFAISAA